MDLMVVSLLFNAQNKEIAALRIFQDRHTRLADATLPAVAFWIPGRKEQP